MLPTAHRFKGQPGLWPMGAEAPAWIWVLPAPAGLLRIGTVRSPPILIAAPPHHPPAAPFLQGIPGWHLPCDPFMPLVSEPALQQWHPLPGAQWVFGGAPSPVMGYSPPASVDFVPVFPHVFTASVPPRAGKRWLKKRLPKCQMFVNSAFSLDSAWVHPEEARIFQGQEKPLILANQISMALSRPPTTTRPRRTVVITPQSLAGVGPKSLTDAQSNQTIAITAASAASMMTVDSSEPHLGSAPSSAQPCCVFTLSPIKIPIMTAPFSSTTRRDSHITPLIPAHLTRLTAMSSPTVTIMATNLVEQASSDKSTDLCRTSPSTALILHTDRNNVPKSIDTKDNAVKPVNEADCLSKGNKPVASTPVPGSPWCIVWTGDDRVFFFNPQMQLSVWEKPVDLKNRGDIIRMIEDPPHKRKLETSASIKCEVSNTDDRPDDHSTKTKRNKMEPLQNIEQKELEGEEKTVKSSQVFTLPLEERSTHFKEMLLERGVSAFSTWEKELHKIVFDPRYLLLNSEERKQVFEQFVKIRIKEEFKEKKSKLLLAKEGFKKLLEESKVSPRTTFKEFSEKYCRDQRFRLVQKKKDQELFFNQYIHLLKKRDKENRLRLRKMR